MKTLFLSCVLLLPFGNGVIAAGLPPFSADDLVRLERASDPQLSPDGRYVAYQLRQTDWEGNKASTGIWLLDLSKDGARPGEFVAKGSTPRWSSDGDLLFLEAGQVWRQSPEASRPRKVTNLPLDVATFVVAPDGKALLLSIDVFMDCDTLACTRQRLDERRKSKSTGQLYDHLFMRHWDQWKDGTRGQLFHAVLDGKGAVRGEPKWISRGLDADLPPRPFGGDEELDFTADGKSVVFTARLAGRAEPWSTNTDIWMVPVDGSSAPRNLTPGNPGYDLAPTVSPDGARLAWLSMERPGFEADRRRVMVRDLATGEVRELAPRWDASPGSLAWAPDSRKLFATADELGQTPLFSIDFKENVVPITEAGSVAGFTVGASRIVLAQDTLGSPAQLFSVGHHGGEMTQLTAHNTERLGNRLLGAYQQFKFKGWDGDIVHGYVMTPAGFEPNRRYPVAFIVHGGPQGSMGNHWHYRWNPQTYAGAGFAVVFIDFHGSTGYGQEFTDSISQDWGGKPLADLKKGWKYALEQFEFLDGDRACALGASYGGYMVNWMASQWQEPFRCFVNHDGIFDMRSMYYTTEELWFPEWEHGGPYHEARKQHEKHNPAKHVKEWKTPMLVVHGGRDFRVPEGQGIATFTALQRLGVESQFLYFPDENHFVLSPHNSVQWHRTVEAWLKRWTSD